MASRAKRKLIFKCPLAVGDIVMLTAAVRDLHRCYPGRFITDVRTACPELWENNPHLTALNDKDPAVEVIHCNYPLIDQANALPYHCLHGFIKFFNRRLGLKIEPTAFRGDVHLSRRERAWYSQVWELARNEIPFWIVAAGGKFDITVKWWEARRYQEVVNHFRGKIQFVQVGGYGDHHPRLENVIDLRGQTDLRQLVRLVYHAHGVLCGVTSLMHLAAAVPVKSGAPEHRACVVVAGGREPPHWEAYPFHQFIHNVGALPCCAHGGCWRSRTVPLHDGDDGDGPDWLCLNVTNGMPRCMDMITATEVIRRIETYFQGGALSYLTHRQRPSAARAVRATRSSPYDDARLTVHSARSAAEQFTARIPSYPGDFHGRGIVICGGGVKHFTNAWVCINMLRRLGCSLPVQLWHLGGEEMDAEMESLVTPLGVTCVDASEVRRRHPARILNGWEIKPYAVLHSPFKEVLLLDADNVPVVNPEFLFDTPEYLKTGAVFWPDFYVLERSEPIWRYCGVRPRSEREFESGQLLVNKQTCWRALNLTMWYNEHSDFFYQHLHGDKDTFHLAFRKLGQPYAMPGKSVRRLPGTMCQHDFQGRRIFQHRNTDKWNLFLINRKVKGFWFEKECRTYVEALRERWDGRASAYASARRSRFGHRESSVASSATLSFTAGVVSCCRRKAIRKRTLRSLARSGWLGRVLVQFEEHDFDSQQKNMTADTRRALERGLATGADYVLMLEDDLVFNRFFWHNLQCWTPLRRGDVTLAGFYNPGHRILACDVRNNAMIIDPNSIYGSQALLLSRAALQYVLRHWSRADGPPDLKLPRLAARLKRPIYYHCPSLVQHVGRSSTWGGHFHQAPDFDRNWKANSCPESSPAHA
jgi:hypothetical protein